MMKQTNYVFGTLCAAAVLASALFGAMPAHAAGAPSVFTNNVLFTGGTSVTMYGMVNPNELATTAWIEYGATTALGLQTTPQSLSGSAAVSISGGVSGLNPNSTYYYRAVAENSLGRSPGEIRSFGTFGNTGTTTGGSCGTPSATTNVATVSGTTATFTGTVITAGGSASYFFDYGTTSAFGQRTPTQSVNQTGGSVTVSSFISNLIQNGVYYYRLGVTDACGGQAFGQTFTLTTGTGSTTGTYYPYGTTYPYTNTYPYGTYPSTSGTGGAPVVSTRPVSTLDTTSATLYGFANPNGSATNAWFEYGRSQSSLTQLPSRFVGDGYGDAPRSTLILGLRSGTTYYYRLVAQNAYGVNRGGILQFTTQGTPPASGGATDTVNTGGTTTTTGSTATTTGTTATTTGTQTTGTTEPTPTSTVTTPAGSPVIVATPKFSDSTVRAEDKFDYTLAIKNSGTGPANDVKATITLPNEVEFVDADPGLASRNGNAYIFSIGTVNAGEQKSVKLTLRAKSTITKETIVQVGATVDYTDGSKRQSASAPRTVTLREKGQSVLAIVSNVFTRLRNLPGYVWFFILLLGAILIVTWLFFSKLRGSESSHEDLLHQ